MKLFVLFNSYHYLHSTKDNQAAKAMENRLVYRSGGDVYITFNTVTPPNPPSRRFRVFYPEHCWTSPSWYNPQHPFFAFVLRQPYFFGPLFQRLQGTMGSFPIIRVAGRFALDRDLQEKWWFLERALTGIADFFFKQSGTAFQHTLDIAEFRPPRQWGYQKAHVGERETRIRITNARNAFVPLMALCSYALATNTQYFPFDERTWTRALVVEGGVDPAWAELLAQTPILSTRAMRIGMYTDDTTAPSNLYFPCLAFNVPLWVRRTGPNSSYPLFRFTDQHITETIEKQKKLDRELKQRAYEAAISNPRKRTAVSLLTIPIFRITIDTRQRPGETVHQFIERDIIYTERNLVREPAPNRERRLARERHAATFECPERPERGGATVFEWVKEETGAPLRRYVPPNEVRRIWELYTSSQKHYNGLANEWDLSEELDRGAIPDSEGDIYDETQFQGDPIPQPQAASDPLNEDDQPLDETIAQVATQDLVASFNRFVPPIDATETPSNDNISFLSLNDIIFYKYGYHPDGTLANIPEGYRTDEKAAMRILAEYMTDDIPLAERNKMCYFVSLFAGNSGTHIPTGLYDLDDNNLHPLRHQRNRLFNVTISPSSPSTIFRLTFHDNTQNSLALYVRLPSIAVMVMRLSPLQWKSLSDIAHLFFQLGVCIDWCREDEPTSQLFTTIPDVRHGLGFRPEHYKLTFYDYQAYIQRRNDLLSDMTIVRAALKYGGIIWRLTIDALTDLHGEISLRDIIQMSLEDVQLTQEQIGIIVGLYNIWTGVHT